MLGYIHNYTIRAGTIDWSMSRTQYLLANMDTPSKMALKCVFLLITISFIGCTTNTPLLAPKPISNMQLPQTKDLNQDKRGASGSSCQTLALGLFPLQSSPSIPKALKNAGLETKDLDSQKVRITQSTKYFGIATVHCIGVKAIK